MDALHDCMDSTFCLSLVSLRCEGSIENSCSWLTPTPQHLLLCRAHLFVNIPVMSELTGIMTSDSAMRTGHDVLERVHHHVSHHEMISQTQVHEVDREFGDTRLQRGPQRLNSQHSQLRAEASASTQARKASKQVASR
jgi:hypothetical protein